jgi:hypothetical protein
MKLAPTPGFDWRKVVWFLHESVICSYCSGHIPETSVPLILFASDERAAYFCDGCMRKWWGMR